MNEEQRVEACKAAINHIYTILRSSPQQWRSLLGIARSVMAEMDSTAFMQQTSKAAKQVWIIAALQMLAFKDVDGGAVTDIASWCSRQWLTILQRDSQNLAALRGLGQMWLSRAQPALARIHASQVRSSSKPSASKTSSRSSAGSSESATEAERRVGGADCVEARGFLQPASEYMERSVAAASAQSVLPGSILAKVSHDLSMECNAILIQVQAAEAYMSLGNVSSPRTNEQHFRRALQLLQRASQTEGYKLPGHLQK